MLPFTIHSVTITNRSPTVVTPSSGITFGWRRDLHPTTSLQKSYEALSVANTHDKLRNTASDPLFESVQSHSLCVPSEPWLRPPFHDIGPSTHPQIRRSIPVARSGHNKVEFPVTAEPGPGGRRSCILHTETSCGSVVRDYSSPRPSYRQKSGRRPERGVWVSRFDCCPRRSW